MTASTTTIVQARIDVQFAHQVDIVVEALGLKNRSEAVRAGLKLLQQRAEQVALAKEYDEFYGGAEAPVSDITAVGAEVAAASMRGE